MTSTRSVRIPYQRSCAIAGWEQMRKNIVPTLFDEELFNGYHWIVNEDGAGYSAKFAHHSAGFQFSWTLQNQTFEIVKVVMEVDANMTSCQQLSRTSDYANASCEVQGDYVVTNFTVTELTRDANQSMLLLAFSNGTELGNTTIVIHDVLARLDRKPETYDWDSDFSGFMYWANFKTTNASGSEFSWVLTNSSGEFVTITFETLVYDCQLVGVNSSYADADCEFRNGYINTQLSINDLGQWGDGMTVELEYPRGVVIGSRTLKISEPVPILTRVDGWADQLGPDTWAVGYTGLAYSAQFPIGLTNTFNWWIYIESQTYPIILKTTLTRENNTLSCCNTTITLTEEGIGEFVSVESQLINSYLLISNLTFHDLPEYNNSRIQLVVDQFVIDEKLILVQDCPEPNCVNARPVTSSAGVGIGSIRYGSTTLGCEEGYEDLSWTIQCLSNAQWDQNDTCRTCVAEDDDATSSSVQQPSSNNNIAIQQHSSNNNNNQPDSPDDSQQQNSAASKLGPVSIISLLSRWVDAAWGRLRYVLSFYLD